MAWGWGCAPANCQFLHSEQVPGVFTEMGYRKWEVKRGRGSGLTAPFRIVLNSHPSQSLWPKRLLLFPTLIPPPETFPYHKQNLAEKKQVSNPSLEEIAHHETERSWSIFLFVVNLLDFH